MQSEQQPVCARCRSVQFISFRFVFLTGQGNQLADIDIKDGGGGGGGDFRHRQLQEMGKVESERNRIQVPGEAQLHSGPEHAHFHSHSYNYSHLWHMACNENEARRSSVSSAAGGNALTMGGTRVE